jgi:hypothetical protein
MNLKIVLISICLSLLQEYGSAAVVISPLALPVVRPIVPIVRPLAPVVIPRPVVINRFGLVGKREANSNFTECIINADEHKLTCTGQHELTCEVKKRLSNLESPMSVIVKDLKIKLAKVKSQNNDILMNIHAEKEVDKKITVEDYTFLNPINNKPIFLSLYSSDNFKNKLGFQFKESDCLKKFNELLNDINMMENFSFQLVIKFENGKPATMETTTITSDDSSTTVATDSTTEAAHDTTTAAATARDAMATTTTTTESVTTHDATTHSGSARDAMTTTTTTEASHDAATHAGSARDAMATTTESVTTHDAITTTAANKI